MQWTWSYGEKPERSKRDKKKAMLIQLQSERIQSMETAHEVSLNHDQNTWNLISMVNTNDNKITNSNKSKKYKSI